MDSFNLRRKSVVIPVEFLTVDECMCSWKGADEKYVIDGTPHITKIKRKPKGIGFEFKSIVCSESRIILGCPESFRTIFSLHVFSDLC